MVLVLALAIPPLPPLSLLPLPFSIKERNFNASFHFLSSFIALMTALYASTLIMLEVSLPSGAEASSSGTTPSLVAPPIFPSLPLLAADDTWTKSSSAPLRNSKALAFLHLPPRHMVFTASVTSSPSGRTPACSMALSISCADAPLLALEHCSRQARYDERVCASP